MKEHFSLSSVSLLSKLIKESFEFLKAVKALLQNQNLSKDVVLRLDEMYLQEELQNQERKIYKCGYDGTFF